MSTLQAFLETWQEAIQEQQIAQQVDLTQESVFGRFIDGWMDGWSFLTEAAELAVCLEDLEGCKIFDGFLFYKGNNNKMDNFFGGYVFLGFLVICWNYHPPSNSDHRECYIFNRESL